MSTPSKVKRKSVNAPFKSPLRQSTVENINIENIRNSSQEIKHLPQEKHHPTSNQINCDKQTDVDYDSEIRKYIAELMQHRCDDIDIDQELRAWRDRMHAYNEAKDACLVLFGQLAHIKGCLVKELYAQHGLELDD